MRLRQIALVGKDLDAIREDVAAVLGLGDAYADPGVGKYGLRNQVWPIGDTFLEVVSPKEAGTTAGRLLEKRGGDGGYMAIFQVDDLAAARARIAAQGVRVVDQADRNGASFTHLHPKDVPGAIVSIDAMEPKERWEWGGPDWRKNVRTDVALEIRGCEIQGEDPDAISKRWSEVLDRPREKTAEGFRIGVDGGEIRFVTPAGGRGEGLSEFDVAVRDPQGVRDRAKARGCVDAAGEVVLCGARVRLVQAGRSAPPHRIADIGAQGLAGGQLAGAQGGDEGCDIVGFLRGQIVLWHSGLLMERRPPQPELQALASPGAAQLPEGRRRGIGAGALEVDVVATGALAGRIVATAGRGPLGRALRRAVRAPRKCGGRDQQGEGRAFHLAV